MFASPTFRVYNQQENKDSVIARKPGISSSARKPLADRGVNSKLSERAEKSLKAEHKKPLKNVTASAEKINHPDWLMDICSYKEVEDTYEDILPKSHRLNKYDFIKLVRPKTPPFAESSTIDPMVLELPQDQFFKRHDECTLKKVPVDDVEFPDFDLFNSISFQM